MVCRKARQRICIPTICQLVKETGRRSPVCLQAQDLAAWIRQAINNGLQSRTMNARIAALRMLYDHTLEPPEKAKKLV